MIDSRVEIEIQGVAQFIQRALNSVSSAFKVQPELELCAENVQAAKNGGTSCAELGKALSMDSRIMPFAHIIGDYCQKFAGGIGGPMIRSLEKAFSLGMSCGNVLQSATLVKKASLYLRGAQSASSKVVDGSGRALVASGISKLKPLKGKTREEVLTWEQLLSSTWKKLEDSSLATSDKYKHFGRVAIRSVMWTLGKNQRWVQLDKPGRD